MNFAGKSIIVTGASRGLGKAIAIELGRRGAMVACVARATDENPLRLPGTVDETARLVTETGGLGLAVQCDLARDTAILGAFETILDRFGCLDMLVNNAAVTFGGDLDIEMKRYDVIMRVNVRAPLMISRLARPYLGRGSEGGRILNIGTSTSTAYFSDAMAFGVSKAGLEYLTISAAAILHAENIAVNCYRIDWPMATDGNLSNFPDADHSTWIDPATAADGAIWMLEQPVDWTGRIVTMLELAEHVPSIARLGMEPFDLPGRWTLAAARRGIDEPVTAAGTDGSPAAT
ncbi:MAG: SDR family NAD(P)-dependent oxidoreductase [Acidimicrobiia bacterium]|nr:SDR family NAD(P)-dependent oxidoreductase [Acidimicrobiia bacterium]